MQVHIDQLGNKLSLNKTPSRIISLVPSQTEFLYHIGIQPIAQTVFCIHPKKQFKQALKIGGTKKLKLDVISSLKPDLIIGNKEENEKSQIEELQQEFPVWMSDINNLDEALEMMQLLADILNKKVEVGKMISSVKAAFNSLNLIHNKKAIYLIWKDPYMAVGAPSFINDMIMRAGFDNLMKNHGRYPELSTQELCALNPEVLLLSTEPFPFKQKHADELKDLLPDTQIIIVDGELFSWYGSRLTKMPAYFKKVQELLAQ